MEFWDMGDEGYVVGDIFVRTDLVHLSTCCGGPVYDWRLVSCCVQCQTS